MTTALAKAIILPSSIILMPPNLLSSSTNSMTCNENSPLLTSVTSITTTSLLESLPSSSQLLLSSHSVMHPDNLLLHNHGVTSPRLSNTNNTINSTDTIQEQTITPFLSSLSSSSSLSSASSTSSSSSRFSLSSKNCDSPILKVAAVPQTSDMIRDNRDDISNSSSYLPIPSSSSLLDSISKRRLSKDMNRRRCKISPNEHLLNKMSNNTKNNSTNNCSNINEHDEDNFNESNDALQVDDRMSCCSDDSELSVGQECCNGSSGSNNNINNNNNNSSNKKFSDINYKTNRLNSNASGSVKIHMEKNISDQNESITNISSLSSPIDGAASTSIISDDMISNHSSSVSPKLFTADDPISAMNNVTISPSLSSPLLPSASSSSSAAAAAAAVAAATLNIKIPTVTPPSIIRPNPTRLEEEFLRKSHLYAEELVKQQIQLMAAARVSAFTTLRHPSISQTTSTSASLDFGKCDAIPTPATPTSINFRSHHLKSSLHQKTPSTSSEIEMNPISLENPLLNLNDIHSHLNTISKISSQLNSNELIDTTTIGSKFINGNDVSSSSRENSQSPPIASPLSAFNKLHNFHNPSVVAVAAAAVAHHHQQQQQQQQQLQQHQYQFQHHPHYHHHNDFNETNLKFSIDNILKADFGRRITDPLLIKRNTNNNQNINNSNNCSDSFSRVSLTLNSRKNSNKLSSSIERTNINNSSSSVSNSSNCNDNRNLKPIDLTSNLISGENYYRHHHHHHQSQYYQQFIHQKLIDTSSSNLINPSDNNSNSSLSNSNNITSVLPTHNDKISCKISSLSSTSSISSSSSIVGTTISTTTTTTSTSHTSVMAVQSTTETTTTSPAAAAAAAAVQTTAIATTSTTTGSSSTTTNFQSSSESSSSGGPMVWPAWVYCTRYSDRPSSGPRTRKPKKTPSEKGPTTDEKRPRTAFSGPQLARLKHEFSENRYLTERRRQQLSAELGLNEAQIKIWFQNKRAKIKKASGTKNPLALQLMAQGLYNHSTVPLTREEEELQELQAKSAAA